MSSSSVTASDFTHDVVSFLRYYDGLVSHVEKGYHLTIYEYHNELSVRDVLQSWLDNGDITDEQIQELTRLDDRLRVFLIPVRKPLLHDKPMNAFWWHGVPYNATGELLEDIKAEGLL